MTGDWRYQLRGRLRDGLDARLASDLRGLVANARGGSDALVLPRSRHPLPNHLPYAFAHALPDRALGLMPGPGFGPRLGYDGRRFDALRGAAIVEGELRLGVLARALEREIFVDLDGLAPGSAQTRLEALLDFMTLVLDGPPGEVVGRMANEWQDFTYPLIRCRDGRIRVVHASARHPWPGVAETLPPLVPAECVELRDPAVADLDEGALLRWWQGRRIEATA